jgi:hypothetical protein
VDEVSEDDTQYQTTPLICHVQTSPGSTSQAFIYEINASSGRSTGVWMKIKFFQLFFYCILQFRQHINSNNHDNKTLTSRPQCLDYISFVFEYFCLCLYSSLSEYLQCYALGNTQSRRPMLFPIL